METMQFSVPTKIPASIFRAYDIRGVVDETLTENLIYALGLVLGQEALAQGEQTLIVARDGRLSGPRLIEALMAGVQRSGCDVIDIGAVPTPVLYFATHRLETRSGVMLTGSHNPANYNGLKMVIAGETLSDARIQQLYQRLVDGDLEVTRSEGKISRLDVLPDYLKFIIDDVQLARPMKVVVDCGNGIAGAVVPALYRELGCDVVPLYCEVDGNFPNHHPDPSDETTLEELSARVISEQADVGLAFDGDGDRLGLVTSAGEIIRADRQLILFAMDVLSRHPNAEIIYDVKCSWHLAEMIAQHGGRPTMWKTGHSLVKAKLQETGALLAGEMSGHVFFKERWFGFDDGLYAGARALEILAKDSRTSSEVFLAIPDSVNTPELKIAIDETMKFEFMCRLVEDAAFEAAEITKIDGLRVDFSNGWGLVRASNTTPYLVARFEADSVAELRYIQGLFREQLLALDAQLELPF